MSTPRAFECYYFKIIINWWHSPFNWKGVPQIKQPAHLGKQEEEDTAAPVSGQSRQTSSAQAASAENTAEQPAADWRSHHWGPCGDSAGELPGEPTRKPAQ
jgi:hypothetical protein